jgi:protein SCO1
MSGHMMNKKNRLYFLGLLASSLLVAGCNEPQVKPLEGAKIGGPFSLIDQDKKTRTYDEFKGQYKIVYFGYTNCPDICSPDMQNMMAGLKLFEQSDPDLAKNIQPMFITIDPKRDTPEILTQFVRAFHPRLIGLTGTEAEITAVSKSFAVQSGRVENSNPENYLMSHSQTPFLMDKDGAPIEMIPVDNPKTDKNEGSPQAVVALLHKWVR